MQRSGHPLGRILFFASAGQILVAAVLMGYLSFRSNYDAVEDLAQQLMQEATTQTSQNLAYLLKMPETINQNNSTALAQGYLNIEEPAKFYRQFWQQKALFQSLSQQPVSAIYYGDRQGAFIGLGLQSSQRWEASLVGKSTQSKFQSFAVDQTSGELRNRLSIGNLYDPRRRPWYQKAEKARKEVWSDIYLDFKEKRYKLTRAKPIILNQKVEGVVGTDFVLSHIDDYLVKLKNQITPGSKIWILNDAGQQIASSETANYQGNDSNHIINNSIADQSSLIAAITRHIQESNEPFYQPNPSQSSIFHNQQKYFLAAQPFTDFQELKWQILVAIPELDLTGKIKANQNLTFLLSGLTVGVAGLIAIWIGRWLAFPLSQLNDRLKDIAQGDLESKICVQGSKEIKTLGNSLNQMSQQIEISRSKLADYNASLEQRVAQRTEALTQEGETHRQINHHLESTLAHLKRTQQQLIQAEQMAVLGQLVAAVAHEINSPLGAIRSSAKNISVFFERNITQLPHLLGPLAVEQKQTFWQLMNTAMHEPTTPIDLSSQKKRSLRRKLSEELRQQEIPEADTIADILIDLGIYENLDPYWTILKATNHVSILNQIYHFRSSQQSVSTILEATAAASEIILALKTYTSPQSDQDFHPMNVIESLESALRLYRDWLKRGIEISKNYTSRSLITFGSAGALCQVWSNLIRNALDAMDGHGMLTLQITEAETWIKIEIIDNGKGIPSEAQPHVFEPFFTTKRHGEGTGLGLGIVRQIIERHQGSINFVSQPGYTNFTIYLPQVDAEGTQLVKIGAVKIDAVN